MSLVSSLSKFNFKRRAASFFLCLFVGIAWSCADTVVEPEFSYVADFNPDKIAIVEQISRARAKTWGFDVRESDREQMKFATRGVEAFYIAFFNDDEDIVFSINNVGVGNLLSLRIYLAAGISRDRAKAMADEVMSDLREQIGVEFKEAEN
jgi:hypothetical protein